MLVAWRDSKVVIVATNYLSLYPVSSTKHWSKAEKKHVEIPMANSFKEYNANMEVLIYLTSAFELIVCESVPKSGGGLFPLG